MTKITSADVRKVAKLARLELAEEKIKIYSKQLEQILDYVAQLEQVNTEGVPETTRAVEVVNVLREDTIFKAKNRDDILKLAPENEGDFYRVPKILSD